jgi:hypothetical protein
VVVGDTIISEQGLVAIIGRDPQYEVCGAAHTFEEANKLVRRHRPNVLNLFWKTAMPFAGSRISRVNFPVFASLLYPGNPNGPMRSVPFVPEPLVTG